jgi:TPR repeat protein
VSGLQLPVTQLNFHHNIMTRFSGSLTIHISLGLLFAATVTCRAGMTPEEVQEFNGYKAKAESGSALGQLKLGTFYAHGLGVDSDEKKAVYWYQKSAEQGNEFAQKALGDCYADGVGVDKDETKAFRWYRKSAGSGLASAQFKLGRCYELGYGVVKDVEKATDCYHEAAKQGNRSAQGALGRCYAKGIGAPKSLSEAYAFFCLAAMSDNAAGKELTDLRKQMSADDMAEGIKRLKEFILEELIRIAPRISLNGSTMDSRMTEQFRISWAKSRLEDTFFQMRKWDIGRCLASAKLGDVSAQAYLGMSYAVGDGVKPDPVRGYAYLSASGVDDVSVRTAIADLAKKMTPEDLSAARDLAAEVKKAGK